MSKSITKNCVEEKMPMLWSNVKSRFWSWIICWSGELPSCALGDEVPVISAAKLFLHVSDRNAEYKESWINEQCCPAGSTPCKGAELQLGPLQAQLLQHHNCYLPNLSLSPEFYHNLVPNFLSPLCLSFLFKCMKTENGVTALKFWANLKV